MMAEEKQENKAEETRGKPVEQTEGKPMEKQEAKQEKKPKEEIRYIVRIAGKDLNGNLQIERALWGIRGMDHRIAKIIAFRFEEKTGIAFDSKIGKLPEDKDKVLEELVLKPSENGVPEWALNRRKDKETGEMTHNVMGELAFTLRKDLMRLGEIKSFRGLRHAWGLPVRGQRIRSTHRGKGGVVGVMKKDAKAGKAAAAKAQSAKTDTAAPKPGKGGKK